LILEAYPHFTPFQVRQRLLLTADNAKSPDHDRGLGRIRVDLAITAGR
jgi:hypothetical protein